MPLGEYRQIVLCLSVIATLAASPRLSGQDVLISEFVASNDGSLLDVDGDPSDWFEVVNVGTSPVSLNGWGTTDDPALFHKWVFPNVTLDPGEYLVVFASGKDRRDPNEELHTNFGLNAGGEFFALVEPDGVTLASAYSPSFPQQRSGFSYGLAVDSADLVTRASTVDVLVPDGGGLGGAWTSRTFVPGGNWSQGPQGVGFFRDGGASSFPEPIAHWNFDGNIADQTGNGRDGSYEGGGAPNYAEGFDGTSGGAISFNGSDYLDVITGGGLPVYNEPAYTIAMWVRGTPQDDNRVYSEGSNSNNSSLFTIGTDNNGNTGAVDIFIRTASGTQIVAHAKSNGDAFDGTWHHIAWVDQNGNADLYIDGVRDTANFDYSKEPIALNVSSIGAVLRSSPCCNVDADIDDFAIWDEALSAQDIAELAAGGSPATGNPYAAAISTDLEAEMHDVNSSAYVRAPFSETDVARFDRLTLRMQYDDGFVAYLNGVEIARRNSPAGTPDWDDAATAERDSDAARIFETIDVSDFVSELVNGQNVLAIHGLNRTASDDEFLISAELFASSASGFENRYFASPSPGAPNGTGFADFVADTVFSHDRGFYDASFLLEISTATDGATIRYTTDQTWPSATEGEIYDGPIPITTTTTVRAAAFRPGFQPSNTDTQSYIFLDDVIRQSNSQPGYPGSWQGFPADYGMDPQICTNTNSPHYQPNIIEDLKSLPVLSLVVDRDDLMGSTRGIYTHSLSRGSAWERPASMEIFHPDGSQGDIQVNCGVRMQGGSSARPGEGKHSFRLLFKGIYGPTKLRYDLYDDSQVDSFDTLVLRCFSTDSWHFKDGGGRYRRWDSQFIRDMYMKDSQLAMGQSSGHNVYVHLYVNGMYWGIYNPSERPDDSFNASHHGGEKEDWDVVKDFNELFRGTRAAWSSTFSLVNGGLSSTSAYQRVQGNNPDGTRNPAFPVYVDVDNIADYMILHLYGCAEDWPHHNWYAARNRNGEEGWRFFVWDQEITMDFVFRNRIGVSNDNTPARVYSQLRANPDFRMRFADRVQKHFFNDGALTIESARARWMERAGQIDRAVIGESARWGDYRDDVPDPSNSPAELYTREGHWLVEQDKVINEYIPDSHRIALERFRAGNLYPEVSAPVFAGQHGGLIESGFELEITAASGTIYYTLDGSDPRLPGGGVSPTALAAGEVNTNTVVPSGAACRVLVPTGPVANWNTRTFNDASWRSTTTGVGYERTSGFENELGEDLRAELDGVNGTIYIRIPFEVADPAEVSALRFQMKYDDGFIAYLNGTQIAAANDPETPAWNSTATDPHPDADALNFATFDVPGAEALLVAGTNVLAIQGMNSTTTSSDMLILPVLSASTADGGDSGIVLTQTTHVRSRTLDDEWSALSEALFYLDVPLRITEIMYHPQPESDPLSPFDEDDFEYLEFLNVGDTTLDLADFRLLGGIDYEFSDGVTSVGPGEVFLLVRNLNAFLERHPFPGVTIAGEYRRNLSNGGDAIRLEGPSREPILDFAYADDWYPIADGGGSSLEILDPLAASDTWGDAASWAPSETGGSPGLVDFTPPTGGLQLTGDANQDGTLDISDAVATLFLLFPKGVSNPPCDGAINSPGNSAIFDLNTDGFVNVTDTVYLLNFLFLNGPLPQQGVACRRIEGCPEGCQ